MTQKRKSYFLLILLFTILSNSVLGYESSYFFDQENSFVLSKYLQKQKNYPFSKELHLTTNFSEKSLWMDLKLNDSINEHYLVFENAHIDSITIFKIKNAVIIDTIYSGDHLPYINRDVKYNFFSFYISPSDQLLIKLQTKGVLSFPYLVLSEAGFFNYFRNHILFVYIFFSLIIISLLFCIVLYVRFKEKLYLYFFLNLLGIIIFNALDNGYLFEIIWPSYPILNNYYFVFLTFIVFKFIFTETFLDLKRNFKFFVPFFYFIYLYHFIIAFLNLLGYYTFPNKLIIYIFFVSPFFLSIVGFFVYLKLKQRSYLLFFIAHFSYSLFSFIYILSILNIIPYLFITVNAVSIATVIEIILIFSAIIDKLSVHKEEKEFLLTNQYQILKEKVDEQTRTLLDINEEITIKNEELHEQKEELCVQKEEIEKTMLNLNETQDALVQTEKMASMGLLTSGIVSEIHQPLSIIKKQLSIIETNFNIITTEQQHSQLLEKQDIPVLESKNSKYTIITKIIENIKIGTQRASDIINNIKLYSKNSEDVFENHDLRESIKNALLILYPKYKNRILIQEIYKCNSTLFCVPGKMNQLFVNLISNAIDSIVDKGEIIITVSNLEESNKLIITISDNGFGIKQEHISKIFNPFYTTKTIGKGTGLGLYIVFGIIEQHKGTIDVQSEVNKGTTFTIQFNTSQYEK